MFLKKVIKTVRDFIRIKKEETIYQFFMKDIDEKLKNYKPGNPNNKQDVLKQMEEMQEERKQMDTAKSTRFIYFGRCSWERKT